MLQSRGLCDCGASTLCDVWLTLATVTPEQLESIQPMLAKFQAYAPHWKGPITPEESIKAMISVYENATPEKDGGAFLSHYGNKMWL